MKFGRTLPPAASPIYLSDILSGIVNCINNNKFENKLKNELKTYFGLKYCFLLSSGTAALSISLKALSKLRSDKRKVIIPAFTCYTVPSAIESCELETILCDIDINTLDYNYDQLSQLLKDTDDVLCIIAPHLFGIPSNIEKQRELIDGKEIFIVEDSAQAMGGEFNNKKLGTFGDVSFFSLDRGKAFSTYEGGILLTTSDIINEQIKKEYLNLENYNLKDNMSLIVKSFIVAIFLNPNLFWIPRSMPFLKFGITEYKSDFDVKKMGCLQIGMARKWKKKLLIFINKRKENMRNLSSLISNDEIVNTIKNINGDSLIRYPVLAKNIEHKKQLLEISESKGLGISVTYSCVSNVNELKYAKGFDLQKLKGSRICSDRLIALPIHPYVKKEDYENLLSLIN